MRKSSPRKYTFDSIKKEALKHKSRGEFQRLSKGHYRAAHQRGILDIVCSHMPKHVSMSGKNNPIFKWTNEKLHLEALKFYSVADFVKNSRSAYFTAQNRGILEEICSHMTRLIHKDWTIKSIEQEAFKYNTRSEFSEKSPGAYMAAKRKGIIEKVCAHMGTPRGTSKQEKELFNIVKSLFPNTKKIRDVKVKIDGKPYIKGFDIDILVPELGLGIEYDGPYHHSYEYMRKDPAKSKWSDDDIHNYHEIKDAWFATKGITILHIKHKDWIADKQVCIDRCLEFLNTSSEKAA